MKPLTNWIKKLRSGERRKSERVPNPKLEVYYWDGGKPRAHKVRDISAHGLYLVTEARWYPRTLVRMTLQRTDSGGEGVQSIVVESMVVREGEDGVGLAFLPPDSNGANSNRTRLANGADRKTLDRFLDKVSPDQILAFIECVVAAT
jgi:hypothetical protein